MQQEFPHSQIATMRQPGYAVSMSLKLNIREIRQAKGWTLAQLAEHVGVSIPHMSQVERGIKNVNNHILTRTADALHVKPEDLLSGGADRELSALVASIEGLPPEDRDRVSRFVEALRASQPNT